MGDIHVANPHRAFWALVELIFHLGGFEEPKGNL